MIPSSDQDLKHEEFYRKVREARQAERTACTKKGGGRGLRGGEYSRRLLGYCRHFQASESCGTYEEVKGFAVLEGEKVLVMGPMPG